MHAKYRTIITGLLLAVMLAQPKTMAAAPQFDSAQHVQSMHAQSPNAPLDIPTPVIPSGVADYALPIRKRQDISGFERSCRLAIAVV